MNYNLNISLILLLCSGLIQAQDLSSGLLEREQIPEKYKWDLSDVYPDKDAWEQDYSRLEAQIHVYSSYKGKLGESARVLYDYFRFDDNISIRLEYLWLYAKLNRDVDIQNSQAQKMWSEYRALEARIESERAFVYPELIRLPQSSISSFLNEMPELEVYAHHLTILAAKADHTLSPEWEKFLAKMEPVLENPYGVFGALVYGELPFPLIRDEQGEQIQLNRSNSWRARSSQDRSIRKSAYEGYYKSLALYQNTLSRNLSGFIEGKVNVAEVRNYTSTLEASLDRFSLPGEIYLMLISSTEKKLEPCHRWMRMKKELLDLDTLFLYDTRVAIYPEAGISYTWEEAEQLTYESLGKMGDEYLETIRMAYTGPWIDAYPNKGKETGGYSSGPAGPHPYVKMNWGGELFDFYTLVHELGHFVHASKTMESQAHIYWDYPSFLSEVASTTAENVSQAYLIDQAKTTGEKLYQIEKYLDNIVLYTYSSAMMAEFELKMYTLVEQGEALQAEVLNDIYTSLLTKYYGPDVQLQTLDAYAWMEYPHYYLDYYLFSYATSFSAALQIASGIVASEPGAIEGFMDFLGTGNSSYPLESLLKAGVDLTGPAAYDAVVAMMNRLLDEIELLSKEL